MTNYTGLNCPVCGKPFAPNDDIVVCPECGAPYHRDCYAKAGKCVFSDKHGTPNAWAPPKVESKPEEDSENKVKFCPRCGNSNSQDAMFCSHCGQPLTTHKQETPGSMKKGFSQNGLPFGQKGQPIPFIDPMGGVSPSDLIDDVPASDVAKLVQSNAHYYLPVFMNLKKLKLNRFNFCAFLFSGGWMLYRKQYKIGSIITAIMTSLYLISTFISVRFSLPLFESLLQQAGISFESAYPNHTELLKISELLLQHPVQQIILFFLPTVIGIIKIIIMLIVGFNGNKWYSKHCISKVRQIREDTPQVASTTNQLHEQGGVNTSLAICLLICYMIVVYLPSLLF